LRRSSSPSLCASAWYNLCVVVAERAHVSDVMAVSTLVKPVSDFVAGTN
jgi:hypothetical protein